MMTQRDLFRFCACCPSPCRSAVPADDPVQSQTTNPSSLSMIALAVSDGQLDFDDLTQQALARTGHARLCVKSCPYHHDIASAIIEFVAQR